MQFFRVKFWGLSSSLVNAIVVSSTKDYPIFANDTKLLAA